MNTPNNTDSGLSAVGRLQHELFAGGHAAVHEHRFARRQLQRHHSHWRHPGVGERLLFEQSRRLGGLGFHVAVRRQPARLRSATITSPQSSNTSATPGSNHRRNHAAARAFRTRPTRTSSTRATSTYTGKNFNGYTARAELLGQDVLHLAARSDQRLAEELLPHARRRHAGRRQHGPLGQQRQLAATVRATTSSITRPS